MGDDVREEQKAKKRKKVRAAVEETPPAVVEETPPAAVATEGDAASGSRKSGKKRKNKSEAETRRNAANAVASVVNPVARPPTADEETRRSAQREIQQLVVSMRAEGKSKHEIEAAKYNLKKGLGKSLQNPESARTKKVEAWKQENFKQHVSTTDTAVWEKKTEEIEDKRKEGLEHVHDLVVIPVIWRGRHDQQEIEKAANDVKAFLSQQGLDVWVDSRRQYTPGQKFAHWEFRGVMLRIEIGPEDFLAGKLRLCRAKEAGDYKSVEKKTLWLPPRGSRRLLLALKDMGVSKLDRIERRPGDDDSDQEDAQPLPMSDLAKSAQKVADNEREDVGGNWAPREADPDAKKKKKRKTV